MFYVYVLKSIIKNWFYIGLTTDIKRRLKQHNSSQVRSTKLYKPYILIYSRDFNTRIAARDFEKFLKIRSKKELILKKLGYL